MIECLEDDPPLQLTVERDAEVVPHHEGDEDGARRLTMLRHVERYGDGYGGDASSLDGALHERDGLMSYRSSGREQRDISVGARDGFRYVLGQGALQPLRVHVVADEGEEVRRQPPN
jgi:hypothetical protein